MSRSSDRSKALRAVKECLNFFEITPVNREILEIALSLPGADNEDNIQTASAFFSEVDTLITRDPKGFPGSPIEILSPHQLFVKL